MPGGGFPGGGMPGMPGGGFPGGMPGGGMFNSEQDIDELIKSIDKQIAALEAEEKANKEKEEAANNKNSDTPEKVEKIDTNNKGIDDLPELPRIDVDMPKLPSTDPVTQEVVENEVQKPELETVTVPNDNPTAPKVSEVVHSNMVNLENFKLKDQNVMEKNDEQMVPKAPTQDDSSYDDFFDDFFDD